MILFRSCGAILILCLSMTLAVSQYAPPPAKAPPADVLKTIDERVKQLGRALERLRQLNVQDPALADIEIFHKAVVWQLRHHEFYNDETGALTLAVLDRGLLRASQRGRGDPPWLENFGFKVAKGYRSRVDGSVQPYAVTYPSDYLKNPNQKWRVDVVLHGRNPALTEVAFLADASTEKPAPKDLNHVRIDIYGRGNNAYRWAGETDVYEAVDHFLAVEQIMNREKLVDPARFVLRGFSMGGAGTWHLGLHRPDRWCVIGPGAGFTTTHGYATTLPEHLPPYQEACLSIYDALDYAENATMVPVVAYSGELDAQKAAADNIEGRLKKLGVPMTGFVHLVAPGEKHRQPAEWVQKQEKELARFLEHGRPPEPKQVRFVTYTLRYPSCEWVELLGLEKHYQRAEINAKYNESLEFTVKTENITALRLRLSRNATAEPVSVAIDREHLTVRPLGSVTTELNIYLEKRDGKWASVLPQRLYTQRLRQPTKAAGIQGPIDDAFTSSFLCVRGTNDPWHARTNAYARANLERFQKLWSKHMRGELPIKEADDVTPDDIANRNLILFGDPGSNPLIEQALNGLPFQWTKDKITWGGKEYPAGDHVPVLIYPSPFNPERYVVLNSGHTFSASDFEGTNALLFPRLGDYALLKLGTDKDILETSVEDAGLFNDRWSR